MSENRTIHPAGGLRGEISVPGDKSISHRSIMLGSLAEGATWSTGFCTGEDNHATLRAFRSMGIAVEELPGGELRIEGKGLHGLSEPDDVIDCGNSGTTIRLMTGLLAGQSFFSVLTGDRYLRKRPMKRVVSPSPPWAPGSGDGGRATWLPWPFRAAPCGRRIRFPHRQRPGEICGTFCRPYAEGSLRFANRIFPGTTASGC